MSIIVLAAPSGPTVLVTPHLDADPCPRVEVFATELGSEVARVTVTRVAAGREFQVRGAVRAATAGALSRIDFEVPFGVPVTYRAEMFSSLGASLGFIDSVPVTLDVRETWLHNPLDPRGATVVELGVETGEVLSRPVRGTVSRPIGRRVGVVLAEPRSGLSGFEFDVRATSLEQADRVQAMIGTEDRDLPPVLCVRPGAGVPLRVPQPLFLGVLDIAEVGLDVRWGGQNTIQRMQGDEVAPPVPGLFVPLLTNADINASFATNADLNAIHPDNASINRRYDLAGVAGQ